MGRQIAADDPLFSAGGTLGGAASGGVDLNLEGGQNHVDFDLLGEPSIAAEPPPSVDLDLGSLPAGELDTAATGEAPLLGQTTGQAPGIAQILGDTGVDFILDDPARGADATGHTRKLAATETIDAQKLESTAETLQISPDAPTVEQLRPGMDHGTLRQKLDASARAVLAGAEQTAELALDDLGLDVQADTTGLQSVPSLDQGSDSAPTMLANFGEHTRETREMPAVDSGASGTWLLTDKDFSEVMPDLQAARDIGGDGPTQIMSSLGDTGLHLTSQIQALKGGNAAVDHDLAGLDTSATGSLRALDLDLGTASTMQSENRFSDTQRLESVDIPPAPPADGMEPATMSEVGTKLDLARAYMDMGDPEGARSILEEVLSEGSASQKTEARRLIESLPG
jgi:pilus assembly protein FimV